MGAYLAAQPEVRDLQGYAGTASPITFNGLVRQYYLRADAEQGDLQVNLVDKAHRHEQSHAIAQRLRPQLEKLAAVAGARLKVVEVPPGPPVQAPLVAEIYGPDEAGRQALASRVAKAFGDTAHVVGIDTSLQADAPRSFLRVQRQRAETLGISVASVAQTVQSALMGVDAAYLHDRQSKYPVPIRIQLPLERQIGLEALLALPMRSASGALVPLSELVVVEKGVIDKTLFTKDLLPVSYVMGDVGARPLQAADATAGFIDSPLYGLFGIRSRLAEAALPGSGAVDEYWIRQPSDPFRSYAIKWDGEWQITFETFRDMGAAYGVGLILIYLLVVAQFRSYLTPLIIMAPIPLTIIGVMPGHALLHAQYTATSMIGMIALAGIIVRNSILLVDFIELEVARGVAFQQAVLSSAGSACPADRTDRSGGDDRRFFHPGRPDLQWSGGVADLRHLRLDPADAGRDTGVVLRGVSQEARLKCRYSHQPAPFDPFFSTRFFANPRSHAMTVERYIHIFAGLFILVSLALGVQGSPLFVNQWWLAFTAFVGANLFQFGFTNVCPLGFILKKLGVPEGVELCPLNAAAGRHNGQLLPLPAPLRRPAHDHPERPEDTDRPAAPPQARRGPAARHPAHDRGGGQLPDDRQPDVGGAQGAGQRLCAHDGVFHRAGARRAAGRRARSDKAERAHMLEHMETLLGKIR
jgi:hypothetical protein